MALQPGTSLAGYKITGVLGQGGMGVVYEATQISLNRTVALKVLAPHLGDDILFRERFVREGQIQAGMEHAHIVTVYEAGTSEHGFFIAMRLIRGPNLKDMIVSRELDPGRTLRILTPISEALDVAHAAGLIHRDIKPQNILVGSMDQAFLADFGLTKASGEKSLTKTGQFVGTFDYISPEQIKGERATTRSDVYALAAVLYECLSGLVPFPKDSEAAVLYAHMAEDAPKLTEQRPELPATLDEVIAKGMAKDPTERYESGGQLLLDANRTFTRRTRAAFTPPRPIETPQETGIRSAEVDVSTRQSPAAPDPDPPTEQGALEADTRSPAELGETVIGSAAAAAAGAAAAETAPAEASPAETVPGEAPPEETAPGATAPGDAPAQTKPGEPAPPESVPGETVVGAAPTAAAATPVETAPGETVPGEAAPGETVPGEAAPGETVPANRPARPLPARLRLARPPPARPLPARPLLAPPFWAPLPARPFLAKRLLARPSPARPLLARPLLAKPARASRPRATPRPATALPAETAPGVTAPGETAPDAPGQTSPPASVPEVTVPGKAPPSETVLAASASAPASTPGEAVRDEDSTAGVEPTSQPGARSPEAPARRAGTPVLIAAAALLAILVVVAGYLIGSSGGGDSEETTPVASGSGGVATGGSLEIKFPATWRQVSESPAIPGLELRNPIGLNERGAPKTNGLSAGVTDATGPALLPTSFLSLLDEAPPRDDAVKLGQVDAYRYEGLKPEGFDGSLTLYVAPTTDGVATVACAAGSGAAEFLPSCEGVATGLRLVNTEAYALGADDDYLAQLDETIGDLNSASKKGVAALKKAKTPSKQASAAQSLSKSYAQARGQLAGLTVSPAVAKAAADVRAALKKTENAYSDLASAAKASKTSAYNKARSDVGAGQKALQAALKQVSEAS